MIRFAKVLPHLSVITIRRGLIGGGALVYESDFSGGNFDELIRKARIVEIVDAPDIDAPDIDAPDIEAPVEAHFFNEHVVPIAEPIKEKYEIPRIGRKNRKK